MSFSGGTLIVRPEGETATMRIAVRPSTRMLEQQARSISDIQLGDFIGATLARNSLGVLSAQELHIFPKSMQGSGEGLYPAAPGSPGMILDGTVGQMNTGRIGVKFRGATGEGPYKGGPNGTSQGCNGRAPPDPLGGCQGSIIIAVPATTPVMALVEADKSHVKPGAVLALSIMSGPDGRPATPGFTIQSVETPPAPQPAMGDAPARPAAKISAGKSPQ